MARRVSWCGQLVRITDKGAAAYRAGVPLSDNPYLGGYRGHGTGPGGNLQAQRRRYWAIGWEQAEAEDKAAVCSECGEVLRLDVASGAVDCVGCGFGVSRGLSE